MSASQAQETHMENLPAVDHLLDQIPCPRFTFSWPNLTLESHSTSAAEFLPLKTDKAAGPLIAEEDKLRFEQVFRAGEEDPTDQKAWVNQLVGASSKTEFGTALLIQPHFFKHPCSCTIFLSPNKERPKVVQVLLLSPVVPPKLSPTGSRPGLAKRESSGSGSTKSTDPPAGAAKGMTSDEAFAMLTKVTQHTHHPEPTKKGRKVLSEEELRYLVDDLPEICFIANTSGEVVWFNKRWYDYTGHAFDDPMDGDTWRTTFNAEDMPHALSTWQHAILTATDLSFPYRIKGRDGIQRWHLCTAKPCWDEEGRIKHWAATITNVEELVQARQEAVAMKEHIRGILSASKTVVLSVSPDLKVTFYEGSSNEAAVSPLVAGSTVEGLPLAEAWPDEELVHGVRRVLDEGLDSLALQTSIVSAGKRFYYRYNLTPVIVDSKTTGGAAVKGVSAIGANVTERVETEEQLRLAAIEKAKLMASETAAKEASRLKTEYFTHISHETRTPVAGIISIAELLLSDDTLADEHRLLVSQALRSGEILLELVGMVLDLRKVESGELKLERMPFTLKDVMEDAKLFSVIARKKNLTFVEDIGPLHSGLLLGDRMRIRQVLANGLSNAAKFTDEGAVTLKVRQVHETANKVHVQFTVIDTGCGIAKSVLPTLFQPFRQADSSTARRYGGTGLGLVITRELVTLMGGRVELDSEEGVGTTMQITIAFEKDKRTAAELEADRRLELNPLPAGASKSDRERAVAKVQALRPPGTVKILLAEDNALLRELTVKTLSKMGFQVVAVDDGQAAVAEVHRAAYDLVLMDGQMPVMDGYMATRAIRADPDPAVAGLRIVALTASAFRGDRERCIAAGMSHYISKPVRAKDLEQAVWDQMADKAGFLAGAGMSLSWVEEHVSMTPKSVSQSRSEAGEGEGEGEREAPTSTSTPGEEAVEAEVEARGEFNPVLPTLSDKEEEGER